MEITNQQHINLTTENEGQIYRKTIGIYWVHSDDRVIKCSISSKLRKELIYPTADPNSLRPVVREVKEIDHVDPVAVGDLVRFIDAGGEQGMIVEVLPRRTKLTRRTAVPMPGAHAFEQVIVANVDQVMPVFAVASPTPKWNMLDRYLVSAESLDLPSVICINKVDLVWSAGAKLKAEIEQVTERYRKIGYKVLLASAISGEGIDEMRDILHNRTTVLVGKSGVGKSTLLNTLQPGLGIRVTEVNQVTGKGKHTTTHMEMFPFEFGGNIIDTPGVREFGPWNVEDDDLAMFFPEMRPFVGTCKFGLDCYHDEEPGCSIRKAVLSGTIDPVRYSSYLSLLGGS